MSRTIRSRFVFACSLLLALVVTSPAFAQGAEKVDVAVLNLDGTDVSEQELKKLSAVLRDEVHPQTHGAPGRQDWSVQQSSINLSEILVVLGCSTANKTCLNLVAEQVEADLVFYGSVTREGGQYSVEVEIYDARRNLSTTLVSGMVPGDTLVSEFRRQVRAGFSEGAEEQATVIRIRANVAGAEVRIEETFVGEVPFEREGLPPGAYRVEVSAEGYAAWRETIELGAGDTIERAVTLVAAGEVSDSQPAGGAEGSAEPAVVEGGEAWSESRGAAPPAYRVSSGPNWAAWGTVGVGAVLLGGSGAMAWLMDRKEQDLEDHYLDAGSFDDSAAWLSRRDELVDQGESYEVAHRVLLGAGAVSLAGGVVWLLVDGGEAEPRASAFDFAVGPRGASATLRW